MNDKKIGSSKDAFDQIKMEFDTFQEKVLIIGVTSKNEFKYKKMLSLGSHTSSVIDPLVIFRDLLLNDCTKFFLFHNHPSGDIQPSNADLVVTKKLIEQCNIMGITFLDHIVFSDETYFSMFDNDVGGFM